MTKTIHAWHFMADHDDKPVLRDGRPCPAKGVTLRHYGALGMCSAGYHASRRAIDALGYAPGPWVARVRLGGKTIEDANKVCAETRTVIAGPIDATAILREFAAACAYRALERHGGGLTEDQRDACLWACDLAAAMAAGANIPDEERAAAGEAAWAARAAGEARAAAWEAAWAAAGAAAGEAAREGQNAELERMLAEAGL
ncbi:MAG: hypothetical protein WC789_09550 [Lentisphaeria bacterium]